MIRALVVLALASGCAPHATEAIVTVSNVDLDVPGDVDTIEITVRQASATGVVLSSAQVKPCAAGEHGDGCKALPFTVLFVPGDKIDTPARIELRALSAGAPVIDDAFVLAFVRGQTLRYDLPLYRVCKQSQCADQNEVCDAQGLCAPLDGANMLDLAAPGDFSSVALDGGSSDGPRPPRRVFLTAAAMFGNFGGLAGGNMKCMQEAQGAGLTGNFVAILGASAMSPKSYLVLDGVDRPIVRTDGMPVATDATFWETTHLSPINVGPNGQMVPPSGTVSQNAWTGFDYTGASVSNGTCLDWTGTTNGFFGDPYGDAPATIIGAWASYSAQGNCTSNYPCHLYCMEQ